MKIYRFNHACMVKPILTPRPSTRRSRLWPDEVGSEKKMKTISFLSLPACADRYVTNKRKSRHPLGWRYPSSSVLLVPTIFVSPAHGEVERYGYGDDDENGNAQWVRKTGEVYSPQEIHGEHSDCAQANEYGRAPVYIT